MPKRETSDQQRRRLIREVLEIIPNLTSGRGSFGNMPPRYTARHDGEWVGEFLQTLDPRKFGPLHRDALHVLPLVQAVHRYSYEYTFEPGVPITYGHTIASALGYITLEMLVRRLTPAIDVWGYATQEIPGIVGMNARVSQLRQLLEVFEHTTRFHALRRNLKNLNSRMKSREHGRGGQIVELDLYGRIQRGRNLLLYGNETHSFEAHLLVLLIDLILLHVMVSRVAEN